LKSITNRVRGGLEFALSAERPLWIDVILTGIVLGFAFVYNWLAANRGIYFYDYSIVFDGAWKIAQGQTPYKDFARSHAPGAYYLLAGAFRLFGATYITYIGFASALNLIGVFCAIRIGRKLGPGTELLIGLLTAVWYMPILGFPQIEYVAFCMNFVSLWLVVEAFDTESRWGQLMRATAGFCLFAAIMTKQNAGVLFAPVVFGCMVMLPFGKLKPRIYATVALGIGFVCALGYSFFGYMGGVTWNCSSTMYWKYQRGLGETDCRAH